VFTVTATGNTGAAARTANVTVAGQAVAVTQAAPACSVAVTPPAATVSDSATNTAFGISAADSCVWTATSGASWLSLVGGSSGTGNGSVTVKADRNTALTVRTGTVMINGQVITVTQVASGAPKAPKGLKVMTNQ
jgi:hypothetical protein